MLCLVVCLSGFCLPVVQADELDFIRRLVADKERTGHPDSLAPVLAARDATFYNYGMSDSVLHYVAHDLEWLRTNRKWKQYYEVWMYRINTYIYYDNQKSLALRDVQAMYEDAKERDNDYGMGIAYYAMGNVYQCLGSLDESADAYRKGLDILSAIQPLPPVIPELFSNLGDVLNEQHQYQQLQQLTVRWKLFLNQFIPEHKLTDTEVDMIWFYYDLACVQVAMGVGNLGQAETLLQQTRRHVPQQGGFFLGAYLSQMTQLRMRQGRYADAYELNKQRLALVDADEDKYSYMTDLVLRGEIMEHLGLYEESTTIYKDLYHVIDSINRADTKRQLTEMNTLFEVDDLKMQQERVRFRLLSVFGGIILMAMGVFIFFRIRSARKLRKAHDELLVAYDQLEEHATVRERIASELRIARDIQQGMVPQQFPEHGHLDLYASMNPAKAVGGDLYDFLLMDDLLYFCVGDVSGKGVPASLFMAQAIRLFRTYAKLWLDPAAMCSRMNSELTEANDQGMFVTMFMGVVNLESGRMKYCNAGHNPPIIIRDGHPQFMEMETNAPIGLWPELEYEGEEIEDIRGCPLFIYTDGLNEAENCQQEQFSDERLLDILTTTPFESSRQIVELLKTAVEQHRNGAEPSDDLTMMCVKVTP